MKKHFVLLTIALLTSVLSMAESTFVVKNHNRIKIVIPEISTAIHGVESKMQYEISEIISLSIPKDLGTISGIPHFSNNRIFICDSQKKYVLVFDSNGNYLFKVGGVGHAQNEIIDSISDFDIDKSVVEKMLLIVYDSIKEVIDTESIIIQGRKNFAASITSKILVHYIDA